MMYYVHVDYYEHCELFKSEVADIFDVDDPLRLCDDETWRWTFVNLLNYSLVSRYIDTTLGISAMIDESPEYLAAYYELERLFVERVIAHTHPHMVPYPLSNIYKVTYYPDNSAILHIREDFQTINAA